MSFDAVGFKFPKTKVSEGGAGYSEKIVLTFDGNADGKVSHEGSNGTLMIKVSDKFLDVHTLVRVRGYFYGQSIEVIAADCVVEKNDAFDVIVYNNMVIAEVIHGNEVEVEVERGLYVLYDPKSNSYVSYIEFADVHTIDPKYLPGAVLPVVEIANIEEITKDEGAKLTACIGMPIIIKTMMSGFPVCIVANYVGIMNIPSYEASVMGQMFTLAYSESTDVWKLSES